MFNGFFRKHVIINFSDILPDYEDNAMVNDLSNKGMSNLEMERSRYSLMLHITKDVFFEYNCDTDELLVFNSPIRGRDAAKVPGFLKSVEEGTTKLSPDLIPVKSLLSCRSEMPFSEELRLTMPPDYTTQWYRVTVKFFASANTVIGNIHNINKNKEEVAQLKEKTLIDPLSKVYNKSAAIEKINDALSAHVKGTKCAFAVLDIDNFKRVNDTFGHLYGDAVISMVAGSIKNLLDPDDIIGRFGGDEFFIFIDKTDAEAVEAKFESVRASVYSMGSETEMSISIGATLASGKCRYEDLFKQADSALYTAKKNGKNRVEFFDGNYHDKTISYADNPADNEKPGKEHSITETVLEIASKSKTSEAAVLTIMRQVATLMNLDCVEVLFYDVEENRADLLFQYYRELNGKFNVTISDKKKGYYAHEDMVLFKSLLMKHQCIIYTPEFKEQFTPKFRQVLSYSDDMSLVYVSNVTKFDGVFCVMSFKDFDKSRLWTPQELKDILDVEKIVAMHLNSAYTLTAREKTLENKLSFVESGAFTISRFYEESGKLTQNAYLNEGHLAAVHYTIKNYYPAMCKYGREKVNTFVNGFIQSLISFHDSSRIVAQYTDINNIIVLMGCEDVKSATDDLLHEMNAYTKTQPENGFGLVIEAAVCLFDAGMTIGDAIDAARTASLSLNTKENAIVEAKFVPIVK